jgi:hypothetical protein
MVMTRLRHRTPMVLRTTSTLPHRRSELS